MRVCLEIIVISRLTLLLCAKEAAKTVVFNLDGSIVPFGCVVAGAERKIDAAKLARELNTLHVKTVIIG